MRRLSLVVAALLAACGSSHPSTTDAGQPTTDAGASDAGTAAKTLPLTIDFGMLQPGEEKNLCTRVELKTTAAIDVIRIDTALSEGTHQLALYASPETTEQAAYDCQPLSPSTGESPLYISAAPQETLPFPSGVSFHLAAGQMLRVEAHIVNTTLQPLDAQAQVVLTVGPAGTYQPADLMLCGSVQPLENPGVPPGQSTLPAAFYQPPAGIQLFGLETRQFARGAGMTVAESTDAQTEGTVLAKTPAPVSFDDAHLVTFSATQGLRWVCRYNNPSQQTLTFGFSESSSEQCFWWGYYFPSVGHFISHECLQ